MFDLRFNTANEAFKGEDGEALVAEVATILMDVRKKVKAGHTAGNVWDSNGNRVGSWSLKAD